MLADQRIELTSDGCGRGCSRWRCCRGLTSGAVEQGDGAAVARCRRTGRRGRSPEAAGMSWGAAELRRLQAGGRRSRQDAGGPRPVARRGTGGG